MKAYDKVKNLLVLATSRSATPAVAELLYALLTYRIKIAVIAILKLAVFFNIGITP